MKMDIEGDPALGDLVLFNCYKHAWSSHSIEEAAAHMRQLHTYSSSDVNGQPAGTTTTGGTAMSESQYASNYYGAPQPPPVPVRDRAKEHGGLAVAALTLGIIGVAFGIIPIMFWLAWILGVLALIFGLVARRRGMGKAGIVLGGLAIVVGCIGLHIVATSVHHLDRDLNCISKSASANQSSDNCPTD